MHDIPYVNLAAPHRLLKQPLLEAVAAVLERGDFILGEAVNELEEVFAKLCGAKHAIAVSSGTDALILALRALKIGCGDEVITAPNSFVATATAIVLVGGKPVFVDVGPDRNLDPSRIEEAITARTRAIMPVHLGGHAAEMAEIRRIAAKHGLAVIDDCAQAVGSVYQGRPVGSLADVSCFSLHPLKNLSACGDAGMLTTDDGAVAERLRLLRNLGLRTRDECVEWSANHRLDTLQAALLLVKLPHFPGWLAQRRENCQRYRELLAGVPGLELPWEREGDVVAYHTFVVQTDRRDALREHLTSRGIKTAIHYPKPIHLQPVAAALGHGPGSFPVTERQANRILTLPSFPELPQEAVTRVADEIRAFLT